MGFKDIAAAIYLPGESLEDVSEFTWSPRYNFKTSFPYIISRYNNACLALNIKDMFDLKGMLIWLYDPKDFPDGKLFMNGVLPLFKKCLKKDKRFIIIPLASYMESPFEIKDKKVNGHSNLLIYDSKFKYMVRVNPNSSDKERGLDKFDKQFRQIVKEELGIERYSRAFKTYLYPQDLEKSGEGHCLAWTLWLLALKLANPDRPLEDLAILSLSRIEEKRTLNKFIKNYGHFITTFTNNVIKRANGILGEPFYPKNKKEKAAFLKALTEELKKVTKRNK